MIDENLKLLCGNNKLVNDEASLPLFPGTPNTLGKDTN